MSDDLDPVLVKHLGGSTSLTPLEYEARQRAGTAAAPVTEAELGQRYTEGVRDEVYGGVGDKVKTAIEGAVSGATLSLSDMLGGAVLGPEWQYNAASRAEANPTLRSASELAGEIGTTLLSGGAGAAAKAARMLPQGALARQLGKYVATGSAKSVQRVARAGVAGAVEGGATAAADYLGDTILADRDIATDALLSKLSTGALAGGAAGGLLTAGGNAAELLASRLAGDSAQLARRATALSGEVTPETVRKLANAGDAQGRVKFADLLSEADKSQKAVRTYTGAVLSAVDDAAARRTAAARELRALNREGALEALPQDKALELRGEMGAAIEDHAAAVREARRWARGATKGVTVEQMRAGVVPPLPEEQAAAGVEALARLDETTAALDGAVDNLRVATGRPDVSTGASGAEPPSRWKAWAGRAAEAGGILEAGQTLGLPLPDVDKIPVVGPALSMGLKLFAVARALRGGADLPATPRARAGAAVVSARERAAQVATAVATRARTPMAPIVAAQLAPGAGVQAANESSREVRSLARDAGALRARAEAQAVGLPDDLRRAVGAAAVRRVEYLAEHAPRPPFEGTPWAADWRPSRAQAWEWSERQWAAETPEVALDALASGEPLPFAGQTVRALYPALWSEQREALRARLAELQASKGLSRARRLRIGAAFDLPTDPTLWPGYQSVDASTSTTIQPPSQVREPDFGPPPVETVAEEMDLPADMRGRS